MNNTNILADIKERVTKLRKLEKPEWEKQVNEDQECYEVFFTYYITQNGYRTIEDVVLRWMESKEIRRTYDYGDCLELWEYVAKLNKWEQRAEFYDDHKSLTIAKNEISMIEEYKNDGLKMATQMRKISMNALSVSSGLFNSYINDDSHMSESNGEKKIDFDLFSAEKYVMFLNGQKKAMEMCERSLMMSGEMLAIETMIDSLREEKEQEWVEVESEEA